MARSISYWFCFSGEPSLYSSSMVSILRSQWNQSRQTVREEGGKLWPVSQLFSSWPHRWNFGWPQGPHVSGRVEAEGCWGLAGQLSWGERAWAACPCGHWFIQEGGRGCGREGGGEQTAVALMSGWGQREAPGAAAKAPLGTVFLLAHRGPDGKREARHVWQKSSAEAHDQASDVWRLVKHRQEACDSPTDTDSGTCHVMGFAQVTAARMSDRVSRIKTRFV